MTKKRSFFERLTGIISTEDEFEDVEYEVETTPLLRNTTQDVTATQTPAQTAEDWMEEETTEGELTVDVYQTGNDIVIQAMIAGVRPEDLDISMSREMVTIKGRRDAPRNIADADYFYRELYWGAFSRTIMLPQEVQPDEGEAMEKNGLLVIRLPKIDKDRTHRLKVRSI